MSSESAYNKRLAPETTMDQVEGLLEHFNIPPRAITFIRKNKRKLQVLLGVVIAVVVFWALYGSYLEKEKQQAATALSMAVKSNEESRMAALQEVIDQYGNTSSATWARVQMAHLQMKNGAFTEAAEGYSEIASAVPIKNPLYPLAIYGKAQALEAEKSYAQASSAYDMLKEFKGYEHLGHLGKGRIAEQQGDLDRAIAIYNNFLMVSAEDPNLVQARTEMEAKILNLKANFQEK